MPRRRHPTSIDKSGLRSPDRAVRRRHGDREARPRGTALQGTGPTIGRCGLGVARREGFEPSSLGCPNWCSRALARGIGGARVGHAAAAHHASAPTERTGRLNSSQSPSSAVSQAGATDVRQGDPTPFICRWHHAACRRKTNEAHHPSPKPRRIAGGWTIRWSERAWTCIWNCSARMHRDAMTCD